MDRQQAEGAARVEPAAHSEVPRRPDAPTRMKGGFVSPVMEALVSQRVSPLLRLEFGANIDVTEDGGYVRVFGRVVYSFD